MKSRKIYISSYKKKNGSSKIYLQVLLTKKNKKLFDLELEWSSSSFNQERGVYMLGLRMIPTWNMMK
ncbi:hypothetical protein FNH22_06545 [Fulvivirga sp. M361]|uniref:hypothetical protein n=1 Tax=Fulvivirga sp. M361 TaxID=2594266 RepID=UPI00117A18E0|nr:hypothetical protein [Fulvivirga sp. M361]TRX60699.1 hypothetical protein FNH22_06545 [Fulvivirga sp. M361]